MMGFRGLTIAALVCLSACSVQERDFLGAGGSGGSGGGTTTDASSTTGTGTSTSSTGGCAPVEGCFDGVDDDCDGFTDCADPDCAEGAVCVRAPVNFELGVVVGETEPCPDGFTADERLLFRGLSGGGCEGCGCTPNPTDCAVDLYLYASRSQCEGDDALALGTRADPIGFECDGTPINNGAVEWGGVRAGLFDVIQTCTVTGTAIPGPAEWAESVKFCRATSVGEGCDAGEACVPKQAPATQCALVSGSATCSGYARREGDWFQGYRDTRTCSSCSCTASGGDCNNVRVQLGNDYSCFDHASLSQGSRYCGYAYSPPAYLVGEPTPSRCTARTTLSGSLDPTGQSTLCCVE
ncbi:uncharacterized protein SOCEGT47_007430 [Sorangium cellulosum]|uniref:Uncharacterized protein n=1 Tax=Sorangium cellulosum TaxID=56 RepID=A0A4P2PUC5_SORCE|nr:hypothetical protein [Sorangium cellulosum]AUX20277.1 uncharacterized protein SOCEGT47_007430 [Sorangium cellulosum]